MRNASGAISLVLIGILIFGGVLPGMVQSTIVQNNQIKSVLGDGTLDTGASQKKYLVPSYLQVGDLVFLDSPAPPGRWNVRGYDHVAIYLGDQKFVCTTRNDIKHTIEVNISDYSFFISVQHYKNPMFARVVNVTDEQRQKATAWAVSRSSDLYQTWDPRKCADPNFPIITANQWYCSEIVWAAYYNQGIDIDQNGWARDFPWFFPIFISVSPQDIANDNDVVHLS
jgi:hypothetical protein